MSTKKSEDKGSVKVLLKSSIWYTISNFLTRAMAFITTPLFTRLLTKEQYGDFTVFASWQAILLIICGLEIYGTINRARFDYGQEDEFNGYISSCLSLSTGITAIVFILYLCFPHVFQQVLLLDRKFILVMFAYLFTYPAFAMFQAKQRVEYRYKLSAGLSFGLVISSSLFAVLLTILNTDDRLFGRVFGQYMLYAAAGLAFYVYFMKKSVNIRLSSLKYALKIGLPLVFSFLGSQLLLSSDSLIVKHLGTAEAVSNMAIAIACANIVLIFVQTLNNAWAPWFYDKLAMSEYTIIKKTYRVYIWFVVVCTFFVLLVGPEIIKVLGGTKYLDALTVLPAMILSGVFTALTTQFVNLETFYKKTHYAAILTAIAAGLNLILATLGALLWGYIAACYATVLCQIFLVGLHYRITVKMGVRSILPLRDLMIVIVASLMLIPLMLLLYQADAARLIIVVVLSVSVLSTAFIYRKKIKGLINDRRGKTVRIDDNCE